MSRVPCGLVFPMHFEIHCVSHSVLQHTDCYRDSAALGVLQGFIWNVEHLGSCVRKTGLQFSDYGETLPRPLELALTISDCGEA